MKSLLKKNRFITVTAFILSAGLVLLNLSLQAQDNTITICPGEQVTLSNFLYPPADLPPAGGDITFPCTGVLREISPPTHWDWEDDTFTVSPYTTTTYTVTSRRAYQNGDFYPCISGNSVAETTFKIIVENCFCGVANPPTDLPWLVDLIDPFSSFLTPVSYYTYMGQSYVVVDSNHSYEGKTVYTCSGVYFCNFGGLNPSECPDFLTLATEVIFGCTNPTATNYDASATLDDGSCLENNDIEIFDTYPWLNSLVNPAACNGISQVNEYSYGIYNFIHIVSENGLGELYFQNGTFYCADTPDFSCVSAYHLTNKLSTWTCGGISQSILGCTNPEANNYNASATNDDGSCEFDANTEIFSKYPWINSITSPLACTTNTSITDYKLGSFSFVHIAFVDGTGTLYYYDGTYYCSDSPGFSCVSLYNLSEVVSSWVCEEATGTDNVFIDYPWLNDVVSESNCSDVVIKVYDRTHYNFVYIQSPSGGTLYFEDGTYFCSDSPGFSCLIAYSLTKVIDSWSCGDNVFSAYPWVYDLVMPCNGESVEIYDFGNYSFAYISKNGQGSLYYLHGTLYCTDALGFSCVSAYNFTNPVISWTCENDAPPSGAGNKKLNAVTMQNESIDLVNKSVLQKPINIYPNPAKEVIFIETEPNKWDDLEVGIYDINGKKLRTIGKKQNFESVIEIDIGELPKGMYVIQFSNSDTSVFEKLVIK